MICTLWPNDTGQYSEWAASPDQDHYKNMYDNVPDGDTIRLMTEVDDEHDIWEFENLHPDIQDEDLIAVQPTVLCKSNLVDNPFLKWWWRHDSSEATGPILEMIDGARWGGYRFWTAVQRDPFVDNGDDWTLDGINNTQFEFKGEPINPPI